MKIFKLVILSLLFFAAKEGTAQNILVNNHNMTMNMNVTFNFGAPCFSSVVTNTPPGGSTINPFIAGCKLVSVTIQFVDNSCSPPAIINVTVPYSGSPGPIYMYTMCNGMMVNFDLHFNGIDYVLEIID